jgi:hypothetical protein
MVSNNPIVPVLEEERLIVPMFGCGVTFTVKEVVCVQPLLFTKLAVYVVVVLG